MYMCGCCIFPFQERQALQMSVSPKFVPRQHLLQYAIEAAEKGDMKEVNRLMEVRRQGARSWQPSLQPAVASLAWHVTVCSKNAMQQKTQCM
jgi:uncharacterized protein YdiU (UPF0061 family)